MVPELQVLGQSFSAMMKILLISIVGCMCTIFPTNNVMLDTTLLKGMARMSNNLFLPALIITSMGSTLTLESFCRYSILILVCFLVNSTSFLCCYLLKIFHEDDPL